MRVEEFLSLKIALIILFVVIANLLRRKRVFEAFMMAVPIVTAGTASLVLKPLIGRSVLSITGPVWSFPSGHTTFLAALVTAYLLRPTRESIPLLELLFGVEIVVAYGLLLSLTGSHYVTDVLGGAFLAVGSVGTAKMVAEIVMRRFSLSELDGPPRSPRLPE